MSVLPERAQYALGGRSSAFKPSKNQGGGMRKGESVQGHSEMGIEIGY
jgi:hypothetical protein